MVIQPNKNGLLDLDRCDTHFHNIEAKRCKVNNDYATPGYRRDTLCAIKCQRNMI